MKKKPQIINKIQEKEIRQRKKKKRFFRYSKIIEDEMDDSKEWTIIGGRNVLQTSVLAV